MSAFKAPHPFYISTSEQSQQIDSRTISDFGIGGYTLMEVAGYSAARELLKERDRLSHGIFLCGKGNNAGDALVVARYLVQHGIKATLVFISGTEDLSPDTQKNLMLLRKIQKNDPDSAPVTFINSWQDFDTHTGADFIIDGMLGTGLDSDLRGDYNSAVEWANTVAVSVYAIDIPTGLHGDTGRIMGQAIKAGRTFSFGTLKLGCYLNDGPLHAGDISYCELPFPNYLKKHCTSYLIDDSWVKPVTGEPPKHKYEAGVLYVIAGSEGLTGAAMLAAQSAWAEGIGAVILVCPHGTLPIYEETLPQIIKKPVGKNDDYFFKDDHAEQVLSTIREKKGAVLLGPGLGRNERTVPFVHNILQHFRGELIIDADGLWCLAQHKSWNKPADSEWIITPHPGELSTLLNKSIEDDFQRLEEIQTLASDKRITIVSKGFPVIVGTANGQTYVTSYDTRRFSRAGFGDILAGKIGAYRSLGYRAGKSSALALLKGKHISDRLLEEDPDHIIEPKDFI